MRRSERARKSIESEHVSRVGENGRRGSRRRGLGREWMFNGLREGIARDVLKIKRSVGVSIYNASVTSYLYFVFCIRFRIVAGPIVATAKIVDRTTVVTVMVVRFTYEDDIVDLVLVDFVKRERRGGCK
jgi:hypothetical protein